MAYRTRMPWWSLLFMGSLLAVLPPTAYLASAWRDEEQRVLLARGQNRIQHLVQETLPALIQRDTSLLQTLLLGVLEDPAVYSATIVDSDGRLLANAGRGELTSDSPPVNGFLLRHSIRPPGRLEGQPPLGQIRLQLSLDGVNDRTLQLLLVALGLALPGVLLTVVMGWRIPTQPPSYTLLPVALPPPARVVEPPSKQIHSLRQRYQYREQQWLLSQLEGQGTVSIRGIEGFADLMMQSGCSRGDSCQRYLQNIQQSTQDLQRLLSTLPKVMGMDLIPFDIRDCLDQALETWAQEINQKNIEMIRLIYSDVPERLQGDPARVELAVAAILSDVVPRIPGGTLVLRLMLEEELLHLEQVTLRLTVTCSPAAGSQWDTGLETTRLAPSAFIRELVEAMGGDWGVDYERQGGGIVWLTFQSKLLPPRQRNFTTPVNRLVVNYDPHPLARLALHHFLGYWELEVTETATEEGLFKLLQSPHSPPALVIVGEAPGEQSAAFLGTLRQRLGPMIPLLALAPTQDPQHLNALVSAGATFALPKTASWERFGETLKLLLTPTSGYQSFSETTPVLERFAGLQVLVADDHPVGRQVVRRFLEELGVTVVEAANGQDALDQIQQNFFDAVLMDIHMPILDGLRATTLIRALPEGLHLPLIALSAGATPGERERALAIGLNDYLTKPISRERLIVVLGHWVHRSSNTVEYGPATQQSSTSPILLVSQLLVELTDWLANAQQAVSRSDWDSLREAAHYLHGAACYSPTPGLREAAANLERATTSGNNNEINQYWAELKKEIDRLREK